MTKKQDAKKRKEQKNVTDTKRRGAVDPYHSICVPSTDVPTSALTADIRCVSESDKSRINHMHDFGDSVRYHAYEV
jgi:hypothetical protein